MASAMNTMFDPSYQDKLKEAEVQQLGQAQDQKDHREQAPTDADIREGEAMKVPAHGEEELPHDREGTGEKALKNLRRDIVQKSDILERKMQEFGTSAPEQDRPKD